LSFWVSFLLFIGHRALPTKHCPHLKTGRGRIWCVVVWTNEGGVGVARPRQRRENQIFGSRPGWSPSQPKARADTRKWPFHSGLTDARCLSLASEISERIVCALARITTPQLGICCAYIFVLYRRRRDIHPTSHHDPSQAWRARRLKKHPMAYSSLWLIPLRIGKCL
jgi:hypothetical protein